MIPSCLAFHNVKIQSLLKYKNPYLSIRNLTDIQICSFFISDILEISNFYFINYSSTHGLIYVHLFILSIQNVSHTFFYIYLLFFLFFKIPMKISRTIPLFIRNTLRFYRNPSRRPRIQLCKFSNDQYINNHLIHSVHFIDEETKALEFQLPGLLLKGEKRMLILFFFLFYCLHFQTNRISFLKS